MYVDTGRGYSYDSSYGATCNACLKGNFRGRRYKCLICYDYDLCKGCYEAGSVTGSHTTEHPIQCILTRAEFDLHFGKESALVERAQSFTCPFCGKQGFSESRLKEHVAEHSGICCQVICPICAATRGEDPNWLTDDFETHLRLTHPNSQKDLVEFEDDAQFRLEMRRARAARLQLEYEKAVSQQPKPSPFMLARYSEPHLSEAELEKAEKERGDKSLFVRQLMELTLSEAGIETPIKLRAELDSIINPNTSTDEIATDKVDVNSEDGTTEKYSERLIKTLESLGGINIREELRLNESDVGTSQTS